MWTIRREVHPVGQVTQWVKKAGPVVVAPSSNPKFFFFAAGNFFCRFFFKTSERLRRETFFCAWFLKLQKSYAGKVFGAHGLGTRHRGDRLGLSVGCVASSREVGMGAAQKRLAVRACVPGV